MKHAITKIEYQKIREDGTYIVMEGPQFSTLAESNLYRSWKADVIGMTNMPEAKLAREAEVKILHQLLWLQIMIVGTPDHDEC